MLNVAASLFGYKLFAEFFDQNDQVGLQEKFNAHVARYNLNFLTAEEYQFRLDIFSQKEAEIQRINANPENTFTVGHNKFSHLSQDEYKRMLGRKSVPKTKKSEPVILDDSNLDAEVDWRSKGAVNPVQDQAACGSCWAFSSVAAIEGYHFIKTGELLKLSEQQFVDCDPQSEGCNGGLEIYAFDYAEGDPLELEKDYGYTGRTGHCKSKKSLEKIAVTSHTAVQDKSVSQLKAAVAQQPTCVSVDAAGSAWQLYTGGILNDKHCGHELDHAVTAVGYGHEGEHEYLIVRNSWGSDWGEDGYIRIAIDKDGAGICGVLSDSNVPKTN